LTSELSVVEQVAALARRYSERAEAYDLLWSPVIQPFGERLLEQLPLARASAVLDVGTGAGALLPAMRLRAAHATVVGIDNSEGMLRLARRRHAGPLLLMGAEALDFPDQHFDVAVLAFVLFFVPHPARCLAEVLRVLRPGGAVGTITWGEQSWPRVNAIWEEQLDAAGAATFPLPATDSLTVCDSETKMVDLLTAAGFTSPRAWSETLVHRWHPEDHFVHHRLAVMRTRVDSLDATARESCLDAIRAKLAGADAAADYVYTGDVIFSTAIKPS
jgi:ubiquinone/menaquinone biosynthesis C-methylase UbiE